MTRWLLRIAFVLCLLGAAPAARAQYIFLDMNGDGVCNSQDIIASGTVDSVDVWIDTSANGDGSPATCGTGENLSLDGYRVIVRARQSSSFGFVNKMPDLSVKTDSLVSGTISGLDGVFGYSAPMSSSLHPAGKYLLGTIGIQVGGSTPCGGYLAIATSTAISPTAVTAFHSECPGNQADHWLLLGSDFSDACWGDICTATESTTWGRIKATYR